MFLKTKQTRHVAAENPVTKSGYPNGPFIDAYFHEFVLIVFCFFF